MKKPVVEDREFFRIVENDGRVSSVGFEYPFTSRCSVPFIPLPFTGMVIVVYNPKDWLVELFSFQDWVQVVGVEEVLSLEQLTRRIFDVISAAIEPDYLRVTVRTGSESESHPRAWSEIWGWDNEG